MNGIALFISGLDSVCCILYVNINLCVIYRDEFKASIFTVEASDL